MRPKLQSALLTAVLALVLVFSACQVSTIPDTPVATGTWTGFGSSSLFTIFEILLTVEEDQVGRLTGTARLSSPGRPTFDLIVRNGAHSHPDLLVALFTPCCADVNFSGRFTAPDSIVGILNGSDFRNVPLVIHRVR